MKSDGTKKITAERHPVHLVIAIGLFILAGLLGVGLKPLQEHYFPVRFVRIQGAFKYLDKAELEAKIAPLLERGYWEMDLDRIRIGASSLPWMRSVQIQRIWPDTLVLRIDEHVPFARFGEDRLLSAEGVVFAPVDIEPFVDLPLIEGPAGQSADFVAAFQAMQASARGLGMVLNEVRITQRNSWSIQVSQGLTVELGRETPVRTFQRFITTLSLLGEQPVRSMVRADLRYRNGYAVEWKAGTEPEWSPFVKRNEARQGEAGRSI
ncbi:MAG: cell division protein FtsQ/DivIB [Methylococcaceae bacterium]|nr:cell division protein FtsQ/DivIB [Methylococcaceae bacterium]